MPLLLSFASNRNWGVPQAFAKFAMILSVVYDMLNNTALAAAGLQKLEDAFGKFVNNTQDFPLVYDSKFPLCTCSV